MRDCANCFHRKPVLKEDGTWTAECEKWDCEFQSRENMIEKSEDLISRKWMSKKVIELYTEGEYVTPGDEIVTAVMDIIEEAPEAGGDAE